MLPDADPPTGLHRPARSVWLILGAVVVVALAWGYWNAKPAKDETAKAPKTVPPVPVIVAQTQARDWPVLLELTGRGEAAESVTLKPRVDGAVHSVEFQEGRPVAAGAVLLRLDPADFQARVRQSEAALARDQALLDKARADVARYQALLKEGFISQEKAAQLHVDTAAAAALVRADQAALDLARQQLGYTTVRAPFAGVVGARLVHPGASVKVNDTALAVINRVHPLHVSFAAPETRLAAIHAARARGPLMAEVSLPGEKTPVARGRVVFMDNAVDPATGTLRMKAEIPNPDARLTPGQFFAVSLRLDTLKNVVTLPAEAVQQGPQGSFVYVVKPDDGVELRKVTLIQAREGVAAIAQGLKEGETVVTDGHSRLTPASKVKIKTPGQEKK